MSIKKRLLGYYRYAEFKLLLKTIGLLPNRTPRNLSFISLPNRDFLFAAADPIYFKKYGWKFIESAMENTDQDIHIHLYNPTPEQLERLSRETRISVSHETIPGNPVFYQSGRFVAFKEVIRKSGKSGLLLDIDVLVSEPVSMPEEAEFAYFDRFHRRNKDVKILAGVLFSSPQRMDILEDTARILDRFIRKGISIQRLDQLALYETIRKHRDRHGVTTLNELVSLKPDEYSRPINYFKGDHKKRLARLPVSGGPAEGMSRPEMPG